jgi:hypothetical protein
MIVYPVYETADYAVQMVFETEKLAREFVKRANAACKTKGWRDWTPFDYGEETVLTQLPDQIPFETSAD